jgi:hypothetical protein
MEDLPKGYKKMSKFDLNRVENKINPNGFSLWIKEKNSSFPHWLIDASDFYANGTIRVGGDIKEYDHRAVIVGTEIYFVTRKKRVNK